MMAFAARTPISPRVVWTVRLVSSFYVFALTVAGVSGLMFISEFPAWGLNWASFWYVFWFCGWVAVVSIPMAFALSPTPSLGSKRSARAVRWGARLMFGGLLLLPFVTGTILGIHAALIAIGLLVVLLLLLGLTSLALTAAGRRESSPEIGRHRPR